jgi:peptide/nickel transport system substrate-binding protein
METDHRSLVVGSWQEPDNLNAYFTWTASGVWFGMLALESALRPDGRGGYVPVIVERTPTVENGDMSPDGRTITYRLRRDVRWADGVPLTSRDLVYTWKALVEPGNEVISHEGFEHVERIETPDDFTAILHLARPYAAYGNLYMATFPAHAFASPSAIDHSEFNLRPFGTGPFFVEEWERGREIRYRRNPWYRGPGPHYDSVVVRLYDGQDDLFDAVAEGEVDLAIGLGTHHVPMLERAEGVTTTALPSAHVDRLLYNLRDPILGDVRVRHALDHAIDRERISREASGGLLEPACSELYGSDWFVDFPKRSFDPARAAALLEEAGWRLGPDGLRTNGAEPLRLRLSLPSGDALRERVIEPLAAMLRDVGVDLVVDRGKSFGQYFAMASEDGPLTKAQFQLAFSSAGMFGDPEPDYSVQLHSSCIPTPENNFAGGNQGGYASAEVDRLLDEASAELDRGRRRDLYAKVEGLVHADCPVSYLYRRPIVDAYRRELTGLQYLPYLSVWCLTWSAADWRSTIGSLRREAEPLAARVVGALRVTGAGRS